MIAESTNDLQTRYTLTGASLDTLNLAAAIWLAPVF